MKPLLLPSSLRSAAVQIVPTRSAVCPFCKPEGTRYEQAVPSLLIAEAINYSRVEWEWRAQSSGKVRDLPRRARPSPCEWWRRLSQPLSQMKPRGSISQSSDSQEPVLGVRCLIKSRPLLALDYLFCANMGSAMQMWSDIYRTGMRLEGMWDECGTQKKSRRAGRAEA
jgi:hypothetical protein